MQTRQQTRRRRVRYALRSKSARSELPDPSKTEPRGSDRVATEGDSTGTAQSQSEREVRRPSDARTDEPSASTVRGIGERG